ncbi:glycosyl transferase family 1 [Pseudomonas amygdali pv. tabaci str. ATCC 11528]|nr:glycosyltransferase family 4 protein [Pseudomonas amygdali]AXH57824.1 glycosyltransferase [Pseudomonas amygdali pv. lachrymans str. M301315]KEZ28014.1 glycosyl transferase family 1 [Pseudomonas amygdali pv. tabaci str. 6605]KEZ70806.1 glycosyl transferase family 1 [Pseudomonas amygdali pv. tabaci str. ATCC 11528]KKY51625.1 glycosyl transferase family 1 [Pseudomonas amygdali pv. lachrymans]KKY55253.1 glycosyl transferase family 1 [Pseudomonas amygdali pv. tabaci str. ATCC 11528]
MTRITNNSDICLIGHPYAPIGMGEHVRATFRSLRAVYNTPKLHDIYKLENAAAADVVEFSGAMVETPSPINIFHINGNEVDQVWKHMNYNRPWTGYNVIYPLWELPRYPKEWAAELDRFDEVWAPSKFIMEGLQEVCKKPVIHMPLATEIKLDSLLSRRFFGLPEADYVFLFFYDLRSYATRKNPEGVLNAFNKFLAKRPYAKAHLVIKVNGVETNPKEFDALRERVQELQGRVTLIHQSMSSNDVKNLLRCSDCFISLHRSEGYGFGVAEAMALGKPAIATAYSGNMDFMTEDTSLAVNYHLVPVLEGEYPHHENQRWAEPDYEQAAKYMIDLVDDPAMGRTIGNRARLHMQGYFDYRSTGLRYRDRLSEISAQL